MIYGYYFLFFAKTRFCSHVLAKYGANWGFFAITDLGSCAPYTGINDTLVECPAPGGYPIVVRISRCCLLPPPSLCALQQAHTLRGAPEGIQCGLLQPGEEMFNMVKPDPTCSWCYGQASGPVCDDIGAPCTGCWGWTECTAISD